MAKVVEAAVTGGKIFIDGFEVAGEILGAGVTNSAGVAIIDGESVYYIPSSFLDLKETIAALVDIITQVATIATGIDAATNSPGAQSAAIAQLTTLKTQFALKKDNLR